MASAAQMAANSCEFEEIDRTPHDGRRARSAMNAEGWAFLEEGGSGSGGIDRLREQEDEMDGNRRCAG